MTVKLIAVTPEAEKIIAYCARVSSPDQDKTEISGLLKYCIKNGHWSIFETANLTIEVNTSRGISPQVLRHRSFSFQEFSQRYAAVDDSGLVVYAARRQDAKNRQNSIDDLSESVKLEWESRQLANWKSSFEHYQWALDNSIAKECARFVLPLGCSTKLYMQGSIRSWIHYIELRTGHGTQQEHMDIAEDIKAIFVDQFPEIAKALEWTTSTTP
jgi:thymidylate synthase (FAD)